MCISVMLESNHFLVLLTKQEPDLQTFNVVEEHRHWCPWILETTTKANEILPGWKRVLKSLLDKEKLLQVGVEFARFEEFLFQSLTL